MKNLIKPIKSKIDIEAIERYLYKHSRRNHLIWILGVELGLLVSEILNLNIDDVENKDYIKIGTKQHKVNKKIKAVIDNYLISRKKILTPNNALFIGKKHCRLNRSQVYRFLNETCRNLGININISTRTMKKTYRYFNSL